MARLYEIEVEFSNEGDVYGTERYEVEAPNKRAACTKALRLAEDSQYDDPRVPSKLVEISSCECVLLS